MKRAEAKRQRKATEGNGRQRKNGSSEKLPGSSVTANQQRLGATW
jgi:hypothetical protein